MLAGGSTFVAFAGTDPVSLANWISDLDTHLTATGAARGYAEAASAVWARVSEIAGQRPNTETRLFVTGHSLGGALAAITALRLEPYSFRLNHYLAPWPGLTRPSTSSFVDLSHFDKDVDPRDKPGGGNF